MGSWLEAIEGMGSTGTQISRCWAGGEAKITGRVCFILMIGRLRRILLFGGMGNRIVGRRRGGFDGMQQGWIFDQQQQQRQEGELVFGGMGKCKVN